MGSLEAKVKTNENGALTWGALPNEVPNLKIMNKGNKSESSPLILLVNSHYSELKKDIYL